MKKEFDHIVAENVNREVDVKKLVERWGHNNCKAIFFDVYSVLQRMRTINRWVRNLERSFGAM
jgi:hypothetical protein